MRYSNEQCCIVLQGIMLLLVSWLDPDFFLFCGVLNGVSTGVHGRNGRRTPRLQDERAGPFPGPRLSNPPHRTRIHRRTHGEACPTCQRRGVFVNDYVCRGRYTIVAGYVTVGQGWLVVVEDDLVVWVFVPTQWLSFLAFGANCLVQHALYCCIILLRVPYLVVFLIWNDGTSTVVVQLFGHYKVLNIKSCIAFL